jgi:hypothetical protein
MRVKLCAACPYTPRDLAEHYDPAAALHLCVACEIEFSLRETQRRRTCPVTTINTSTTAELRAAPCVRESSASFATIAAAPPCAPKNASSISRAGARTTAVGYGDFAPPEDGDEHVKISTPSPSPDEVGAC